MSSIVTTGPAPPALIVVDWGTSSLRVLLLARDGTVLDRRALAAGIMQVPDRDFAGVLAGALAGWPEDLPAYAGGMIGSRQGWVEAPYLACPTDLAALAEALVPLPARGRTLRLVPGLSCRTAEGVPEVMRGEEVQVFGALPQGGDALLVLPGTHSKWVLARGGRIERFVTFMTGELFALLKAHSILGRLIEPGPEDEAAFAQGVRRGAGEPALTHALFAARTLALCDHLPGAGVAAYLSGLLLGAELAAGARLLGAAGGAPLLLVGEPALVERYRRAAALLEIEAAPAVPEAAALGCLALAQRCGDLA
ncbi:MAG: 2-dehydro-3-deoxygalactonokinase [Geminicoccaceae bacterium]